jgi:hypothetical protein
VLPLVNETGDPKNEYFSDGLSEELISALAQIKELKVIGRKLTMAELKRTCDKWEGASAAFLDWGDDDHFAMFLAELTKVRVPTGEGDTINKALENISKLSDSDLPDIPGYADAPKPWRKLAALHREISRLCGSTYIFSATVTPRRLVRSWTTNLHTRLLWLLPVSV